MIDFSRSTFTWKSHPWQPDPYYRYTGGFVGEPGQVYHVRYNLEAHCEIRNSDGKAVSELFLGAPCRSEYTIAKRNMFQIPSGEFRMAFSRNRRLSIAESPSTKLNNPAPDSLEERFQEHRIDVRNHLNATGLTSAKQIVEATLRNDLLNARSEFREPNSAFSISLEFPVNLINLNQEDEEFQVCTGPVLLPDMRTWDGKDVTRVFVAHAAFTDFDFTEFILRQNVEVSDKVKSWLDKPRGRDRQELLDPAKKPKGYPPRRPRPHVYNEVWERESANMIFAAPNP